VISFAPNRYGLHEMVVIHGIRGAAGIGAEYRRKL
jgi:hypothetical protein